MHTHTHTEKKNKNYLAGIPRQLSPIIIIIDVDNLFWPPPPKKEKICLVLIINFIKLKGWEFLRRVTVTLDTKRYMY